MEGTIKDVRFIGRGCSQSSGGLMMTQIKKQAIIDALALADRMSAMMHGDESLHRTKPSAISGRSRASRSFRSAEVRPPAVERAQTP
jgi:NifU-like protein involved in Fe-S cluster formation